MNKKIVRWDSSMPLLAKKASLTRINNIFSLGWLFLSDSCNASINVEGIPPIQSPASLLRHPVAVIPASLSKVVEPWMYLKKLCSDLNSQPTLQVIEIKTTEESKKNDSDRCGKNDSSRYRTKRWSLMDCNLSHQDPDRILFSSNEHQSFYSKFPQVLMSYHWNRQWLFCQILSYKDLWQQMELIFWVEDLFHS